MKRGPKRNPAHVIRDAEMILMFRDGKTLQEIGDKYGITRERVRQRLNDHGLSGLDGGAALRSLSAIGDAAKRLSEARARREQLDFDRWGMSREEISMLSPLPRKHRKHPIRLYEQQRNSARRRGIGWEITLREWWKVWQESGKWELRGRGKGYCMARWADDGPYSAENVYICTCGENFSDSYITKPWDQRFPHHKRRNPPGYWRDRCNRPHKTHWKFGNLWIAQIPGVGRKYFSDEQTALAVLKSSSSPVSRSDEASPAT